MTQIDPKYDLFIKNLKKAICLNWDGTQAQLAKKAFLSQGNLSKILRKITTAPYPTQINIANAIGIEYEQLISEQEIQTNELVIMEDPLEWRFFNVIRKIKNKDMACEINESLLELESLSMKEFGHILGYLDDKIEEIKKKGRSPGNGLGEQKNGTEK